MKLFTRLLCLLALSTVLLCPAFSAPKKKAVKPPAWVSTPSKVYPDSQYLSAVGSGKNRSAAEADAIRALSAFFGQSVQSDIQSDSRMEQAEADGLVSTVKNSSIDKKTRVMVSQEDIIGVEVPEAFEDVAKLKWYAVAVMDKPKTIGLYSSMIEQNNGQIKKLLAQSARGSSGYRLLDYARVDFASEIAARNDRLIIRLTVLDAKKGAKMRSVSTPQEELKIKLNEIASSIPIFVDHNDEANGRLSSAFASVVKEFGFTTTSKAKSRYSIPVKFYVSSNKTQDGSKISVNYTLDAGLLDNATGERLIPFNVKGRGQHLDAERATDAAFKLAEEQVKDEFGEAFTEYIKQLSLEK